jgi:hypothetical protein
MPRWNQGQYDNWAIQKGPMAIRYMTRDDSLSLRPGGCLHGFGRLLLPPSLHGEIAGNGTRVPRPIGPFGLEVVTIPFSMLTVEAP